VTETSPELLEAFELWFMAGRTCWKVKTTKR